MKEFARSHPRITAVALAVAIAMPAVLAEAPRFARR